EKSEDGTETTIPDRLFHDLRRTAVPQHGPGWRPRAHGDGGLGPSHARDLRSLRYRGRDGHAKRARAHASVRRGAWRAWERDGTHGLRALGCRRGHSLSHDASPETWQKPGTEAPRA